MKTLKYIIRLVLAVAALLILYRFALNGRYMHIGGPNVLDKWERKMISPDRTGIYSTGLNNFDK